MFVVLLLLLCEDLDENIWTAERRRGEISYDQKALAELDSVSEIYRETYVQRKNEIERQTG